MKDFPHFTKILERLPIPIFVLNQLIEFEYVNHFFVRLFEYELADLLKTPFETLFPSSHQMKVTSLIKKILEEKNNVIEEIELPSLTKTNKIIETKISFSLYLDQETPFLLGTIQELTSKKNLETALAENLNFQNLNRLIREKIFLSRSVHLLLQDICQTLTEILKLDLVWISRLKYDGKIFLSGFFSKHPEVQKENIFQLLLNKDSLSYHSNIKISKLREPIWIKSQETDFSELQILNLNRTIYYGCFPIVFRNTLLGTLNLYFFEETFSNQSLEKIFQFMKEVSFDLGCGIIFLENLQTLTLRNKSLKKITHTFNEVVNNFPNGAITVLDSEMVVIFVGGDSYLQFYPTTNHLIGRIWNDIFYQSIPKENLENMKQGKTEFLKIQIQEKTFEIDLVPLFSEEKEISGYIHIAKDITEVEQAKQKAEEANKAKEQFLANMSHELRTPLNGIIGLTSMLLESQLSNEQKKYAESIHASGEHLKLLLNEILDYSKIESGKLELEEYEVNLENLINDVVSIVFSQVKIKRLEFLCEIEEEVPEYTYTDGERIRQVLLNLVGNAIKFTEHGEIRILLKKENIPTKENLFPLVISVKDTGIGIPKEKFEQIMQPFVQADSSIHRKYGGTGLGLTISHKLIEKLGGTLSIESELGKGSTFNIHLPVKYLQAKEKETRFIQEPILILDEDTSYSEYLFRELKKFCANVKFENNKNNFLNIVNNFSTGLVILNHYITEPLSFYVHLIETIYYYKNLKLIFITHESKEHEYFSRLTRSAFELLEKPITVAELRKSIRRILGISKSSEKDSPRINSTLGKRYPLSMLVVEDNYINQYMIKTCLNAMGYRPDMASNGLEALKMVNEKTYDIIFMDMYMPEMDGITASKKIMYDINLVKKPVIIAVTANVYEADKNTCFQVGMKDFVGKPIQIYEFQEKIIKWAKEILNMQSDSKNEFYEYIDESIIKELDTIPDPSGGRLFVNLFQLFLKNSPETLSQLKLALTHQNSEELKQHAHKFKGMSSNLGGKKLAALLKEIELNSTDFSFAESKWDELVHTYEKTKEYLKWVTEHNPGEFP